MCQVCGDNFRIIPRIRMELGKNQHLFPAATWQFHQKKLMSNILRLAAKFWSFVLSTANPKDTFISL